MLARLYTGKAKDGLIATMVYVGRVEHVGDGV